LWWCKGHSTASSSCPIARFDISDVASLLSTTTELERCIFCQHPTQCEHCEPMVRYLSLVHVPSFQSIPTSLGFHFEMYLASRPALRPTHTPIQWVPVAISLGVKKPGREAGYLSPYSVEVKE